MGNGYETPLLDNAYAGTQNPYVPTSTGGSSFSQNFGQSAAGNAFSSGGGFGAIGAGVGTLIGGPAGTILGGAIGAGVDIIAGLFGQSSKRRAERQAASLQIEMANQDRQYAWQVREDQRDKYIDTPQYASAMLNANNQSMANIGSPVLARDDAYSYIPTSEELQAQIESDGGYYG